MEVGSTSCGSIEVDIVKPGLLREYARDRIERHIDQGVQEAVRDGEKLQRDPPEVVARQLISTGNKDRDRRRAKWPTDRADEG